MCLPGIEDDHAASSSPPWPEDDDVVAANNNSSLSSYISSIYSRWTYSYMNRIFQKGALQRNNNKKKPNSVETTTTTSQQVVHVVLTQEDLYQTPRSEKATVLNDKFWALYNTNNEQQQQQTKNNNFRQTLWMLVKPVFVPAGFCQLVALTAQLAIPMCVMKLLQEIEQQIEAGDNNNSDNNDTTNNQSIIGYVMAVCIFLLSIINALFTHRYQFLAYESGIILRSAVTCAIYQHSLKLDPQGMTGLTSGVVTNLVATDTQKLFEVMHDGHQIWSCPLAIVVVIVLLLLIIGPSCLLGAAILIALLPLSKYVAQIIVTIRKQRVAVADERIEIVQSMLQDIKITKLMNYEDEFERRVQDARRREMVLVRKEQMVWALTLVIRVFTPIIASFATFVTYVSVSSSDDDDDDQHTNNNIMTASMVFTITMLFNMLKFPINQAGQLLSKAALGVQAAHRISNFMSRETRKTREEKKSGTIIIIPPVVLDDEGDDGSDDVVLEVKRGTFHLGVVDAAAAAAIGRDAVGDDELLSTTNHNNNTNLPSSSSSSSFTLSGVNFQLKRGEVLAVVGPVGSGKSTLIQAILGDVQSSPDTSIIINTSSTHNGNTNTNKTNASISYAAQTPFILSTTVRENILFGSPDTNFDRERYERVLDACCLRPDLLQWPSGDMTQIGERGVTMSGGQKARVSAARAVYNTGNNNNNNSCNSNLALFDDILSALDANTSQQLFDNLFDNTNNNNNNRHLLLHNAGVVLVTHSQHVLKRVDKILVLDNGEAIFYGTWNELQSFDEAVHTTRHKATLQSMRSSSLQHSSAAAAASDNDIIVSAAAVSNDKQQQQRQQIKKTESYYKSDDDDEDALNDKIKGGTIIEAEGREHGISSLSIWILWFKYAGGIVFITVQIFLMAFDRGSYVAIDWWLATWTSAAGRAVTVFGNIEFPNQHDSQTPYIVVYAVLVASVLCFVTMRSQWMVTGGIRASRRVFFNMTRRVLHAPMSYFDTHPIGRILNRFTFDVEQVDITLAQSMSIFIIATSWLVAGQVVIIAVVPWLFIISVFVLFLYALVLRKYRWSASDLQRLDAVSRSPIQASLAEGLNGSSTIRAFDKHDFFSSEFQKHINYNSSAMLNFVASRRWLAIRLETLGSFVTLSASLCIASSSANVGLSAGLSGLLLVWAAGMTTTLSFLINAFSEAEAAMTSIERMHSLETLPQEKAMITTTEYQVDRSWPQRGDVEFRNVSLRYRPGLPLSLDGLSFSVKHGQRCAIVGRTGAGKSTLTAALFRLVEVESGSILLDGVDLSELGLSDVRGRRNGMFILPQDPVLFCGTIRSNLDPFRSHTDDDITRALEWVKFPQKLLNETVEEGGTNFSAGEKQLLCLARAMLANPRVLVLDEATASIDNATDDFVQRMLRSQFPNTTMLTIAHRLNTILLTMYDVVVVIESGHVAEIGSPRELLSSSGIFSDMVEATGPESAAQLRSMAK